MTWVLAAVSLSATWLNARKHRTCFLLWIGTNAAWASINWAVYGNHARAALDVCYAGLAFYGWRKWKEHA